MFSSYDVIVVGGGHAGCEAAAAAAKMGSRVLLITMHMQHIGQMSCNPAMGGIAKGQLVREIDALGGMSGLIADASAIQFRMLNRSKGPAMWSPRTQNDRMRFAEAWRLALEATEGVDFWQDMVQEILVKDQRAVGVKTGMGLTIKSRSVILTNGTFLNGLIHIGEKQFGGGRMGERSATGLTAQLQALGFETGRMKTGTPPRVDGRTLQYAAMEEQPGDHHAVCFSFLNTHKEIKQQKPCHITYTHPRTHQILQKGFDQSPMFSGRMQGKGPRYCPSIEDKLVRFAARDRHQLFVEPEGWHTVEVYVNGFSTSLPEEVQYEALRSVPGFEQAKLFRPGYAIEYDYFPPVQLKPTLETRGIAGLFFAGQINGTTGYEEAAAQGLMAGINAHQQVYEQEPVVLGRSEAYIGVLIDDLVHKGTDEPYRMFTSRAEFRLLLRQDNADIRLTALGHGIGLASEERLRQVQAKQSKTAALLKELQQTKCLPSEVNGALERLGSRAIQEPQMAYQLLKRPEVTLKDIAHVYAPLGHYPTEAQEQATIQVKYESYLKKEEELAEKLHRMEGYRIPEDFVYDSLQALSAEGREKLQQIRPQTLGQASRMSGVTPADVSILMVYLKRGR